MVFHGEPAIINYFATTSQSLSHQAPSLNPFLIIAAYIHLHISTLTLTSPIQDRCALRQWHLFAQKFVDERGLARRMVANDQDLRAAARPASEHPVKNDRK